MNNKIVLYTGSYPYGKTTESFIGPELSVMSKYDDYDITVVPVLKDAGIRDIPSTITLDNSIVNSNFLFKFGAFLGIFRKTILREIWNEKGEIISLKYLLMAIKYLYATNLVLRDMQKKGDNNSRVVFYAFWLSYAPIAFGLYKKQHPNNQHIFISRGHRIEVYTTELGVFYPMRNFLYSTIDQVYVCSEKGADYLRKKYPFASNKIKRAYLGVVENKRVAVNTEEDKIKIVSCSSVYQFKRVDLILTSLTSFCQRYPMLKIEWTHFGGGTLFEALKAQAGACDVQNFSIKLMGAQDNNQILKCYRENCYDIFIHLSSSEGLPVSMMEAISSSIPILATEVGGVAELVTKQSGKVLDKDFTQDEFDEALRYMIDNRTELSRSAKFFFDKNFNAEINYPQFYREITSL